MLIPFCFNSFLFPDSFFFMTLFINCLVSCTRFCIPVFPAQDVVFLYFLHKILYSCARCCILVFPVQDVVFLYFLYKMFCLISMLNGDSPNSLARGVNVSVLLYFINIVAYRVFSFTTDSHPIHSTGAPLLVHPALLTGVPCYTHWLTASCCKRPLGASTCKGYCHITKVIYYFSGFF